MVQEVAPPESAKNKNARGGGSVQLAPYPARLYQADVPKGWVPESLDDKNSGLYTSQWHDPDDPNTYMRIDAKSGVPDVSPLELAAPVRQDTRQTPGYEEIAFQPTTLDGQPAAEWIFEVPGVRKVDYFISSCGVGVAVLGATSPERFDALAPTFRAVAKSVLVYCE